MQPPGTPTTACLPQSLANRCSNTQQSEERAKGGAHLKANMEASLKASSLESTACAAPSVSTTRTPCCEERTGEERRGKG